MLRLARMWRFTNGQAGILKRLEAMTDLITKILLYEEFDLDEKTWLLDPVTALAERTESLTISEGQRLGVNNVVKIAALRETFSFECCDHKCGGVFNCRAQLHSLQQHLDIRQVRAQFPKRRK